MDLNIPDNLSESPARIYKFLTDHVEQHIPAAQNRNNIEIIMDHHWIFLHCKQSKQNNNIKKHIGKWRYEANSNEELIRAALKLLPLVAEGKLNVVKFTSFPNVFSSEKILVVYCFEFGPDADAIKQMLTKWLGGKVHWGSRKHRPPGLPLIN